MYVQYFMCRFTAYDADINFLSVDKSFIPCSQTVSHPLHITVSHPLHRTVSNQLHRTVSHPLHRTVSNQLHRTVSHQLHRTVSHPLHRTLAENLTAVLQIIKSCHMNLNQLYIWLLYSENAWQTQRHRCDILVYEYINTFPWVLLCVVHDDTEITQNIYSILMFYWPYIIV
jgi:hypothetical protein